MTGVSVERFVVPVPKGDGHPSQRQRRARLEREYAAFNAEQMARRTVCEAPGFIRGALRHPDEAVRDVAWSVSSVVELACGGRATELHHRRMRSHRGALSLEGNTLALCDPCHDWCHANMAAASTLGLIVREGHPEWLDLGQAGRS